MKQGIYCNLSVEDVLPPEICPVLGLKILLGKKQWHPQGPSVDRLRPNLGYTKGNVAVISWRANRLKSNCEDPEELRAIANWMERMIS